MKIIALQLSAIILVGLLHVNLAMADWQKFDQNDEDDAVFYADPDTARWGGLEGEIRILKDYKTKMPTVESKKFWSATWTRKFDCEMGVRHDTDVVFYSGHMGEGTEVYRYDPSSAPYRVPPAEKKAMNMACGGLIKMICRYDKVINPDDEDDDEDAADTSEKEAVAWIPATSGGEGSYTGAGWVHWTVTSSEFVGRRRSEGHAPFRPGMPAIPTLIFTITISKRDGRVVFEFHEEGGASVDRQTGTCKITNDR